MVRHIIMWNMKEGLSAEESLKVKTDIKEALETLKGEIPCLRICLMRCGAGCRDCFGDWLSCRQERLQRLLLWRLF